MDASLPHLPPITLQEITQGNTTLRLWDVRMGQMTGIEKQAAQTQPAPQITLEFCMWLQREEVFSALVAESTNNDSDYKS